MKVSIEKNYTGDFTITVENAQRADVLAIRKITDESQQITQPVYFDEVSYAEPRNWSRDHQQAFVKTAQMHFREGQNKIMTIKFLRSLSEPCLGLKDAKDIAFYAIHGPESCPLMTWLKG